MEFKIADSDEQNKPNRRSYSIFKVPSNFIDSFGLIELISSSELTTTTGDTSDEIEAVEEKNTAERWTCNACNCSFHSLHEQRSHCKSDFHRFNIKLSIAGKDILKEDDFDELRSSNSLVKDHYTISSISCSEDEDDREFGGHSGLTKGLLASTKQKVFVRLSNGEIISLWKCLLLGDSEKILFENDLSGSMTDDDASFVTVREVIEKLLYVINEPRNNTCLRVMLLASGGHFAGCVFDGNIVVTHKTFHRYVVRAKAGKNQSSKDAGGKFSHSAGASIRRHNKLALTKVYFSIIIKKSIYSYQFRFWKMGFDPYNQKSDN